MPGIGEIVTSSQLKSLQDWSNKSIAQTVYVNPTVYKPASQTFSGWNYYASAKDALNQWAFLNGIKGFTKVAAAGSVQFKKSVAETFGVTVDFFFYHPVLGAIPVPYAVVKQAMYSSTKTAMCIIRFYKTDGSGPYWAILDNRYLAITSTKYTDIPANKVQALTDFHNTVQRMKIQYNTLAAFVTNLSKRKLSAAEQQIFNESMVRLNNFQNQLRQLKGVTIVWGETGQVSGIGIAPIIWMAIIVVSAITVTYSVEKILLYLQDARIVEQSNGIIKYVNDQRLKIAAALKAGDITPEQAAALQRDLNATEAAATKNIVDVANKKEETIIDKIGKYLLWGTGIYLGAQILKGNNNG